MSFEKLCEQLENKIVKSYDGVTLEEAEQLAAEFLYAQIIVSKELKKYDLDSRMRKSSVKSIRSAVYKETISLSEKKPTEAAIEAIINTHKIVQSEQNDLDIAETVRDNLDRYYSIFLNAHIYYRGLAKGRFDGV